MMNGKARYDRVESTQIGEGTVEVVLDDLNLVVAAKSFACGVQHRRRKVECDALGFGAANSQQREQAAVSGPQIENALSLLRDELEQHCLAFSPMRNAIRAC